MRGVHDDDARADEVRVHRQDRRLVPVPAVIATRQAAAAVNRLSVPLFRLSVPLFRLSVPVPAVQSAGGWSDATAMQQRDGVAMRRRDARRLRVGPYSLTNDMSASST